jgi:hypothetical protein
MVKLKYIEGRVFRFRKESDCAELGTPIPEIEEKVRIHIVILLDLVLSKRDWVKVMTVCALVFMSSSHSN